MSLQERIKKAVAEITRDEAIGSVLHWLLHGNDGSPFVKPADLLKAAKASGDSDLEINWHGKCDARPGDITIYDPTLDVCFEIALDADNEICWDNWTVTCIPPASTYDLSRRKQQ